MTTATLPRPAGTARHDPVAGALTGFDHLDLWAGNARALAHFLVAGFGFRFAGYSGPETGARDRVRYLVEQGDIRLWVTGGLAPDSPVAAHVRAHGDGVHTVAVGTADVDRVLETAAARGARVLAAPRDTATGRRAAVALYGETRLEFVARDQAASDGFDTEGLPSVRVGDPVGLTSIDHVVGNVEEGRLDEWVSYYERVLGFEQMRHFDADQISTEFSALRSTVMWNGGTVVMPVNEPAEGRRKSQITEYLESYGTPGVQHVALATGDIVTAVDAMARRGVRFLVPPATYYEDARRRVGDLDLPWADLERLGILVDVDGGGHLLQVFTENVADRPTLFVEVIQREGATGFGEGNFKALFEAIEREQARRGNL